MRFTDIRTGFSGELRLQNSKLHRESYEKIATILTGVGSIVRRLAVIEKVVQDDKPPVLIANADLMEVIFPEQQVCELVPASYIMGVESGKESRKEYRRIDQRWSFDPEATVGHLLFQYDGHSKAPLLAVNDIQVGFSELPEAVCRDISEIFGD